MLEIDRNKYYKLIDVLNLEGVSKVEERDLYKTIINCTGTNIRAKYIDSQNFIYKVSFVLNAKGQWTNESLRTSLVSDVLQEENILKIFTMNSIYVFKEAEEPKTIYTNSSDLIELFLNDKRNHFCKGIYYDENKCPHELFDVVNVGMFVDSCLISLEDDGFYSDIVCRYFIKSSDIEFYDTLYNQQDYSTKMKIHNTAEVPLTITFEWSDVSYEIPSGECIEFIPPLK